MKIRKNIIAATFLSAAAISAPASAQVAGIATSDRAVAIIRSKAFGTSYQQIGTQFSAVTQQLQAKRVEINNLIEQLDINKDKELTQVELDVAIKAKSPLPAQLDTKQMEMETLQEPILLAQLYAVDQIALKYDAAQQAVITAKKINLILVRDAFVWAPEAVDVTPAITAELDKAVPSVTITPPAGWRPSRPIFALNQQIQQIISAATQQAQAAAAAQARSATPAAQPESR
jgi:Skp family chaperone for outer membrane proteins